MTFSEPAWTYRFALRLTYGGEHYYFSRFFFMLKLAQHMHAHYPPIDNDTEPSLNQPLQSVADFLRESQRLKQVLSKNEDDKRFEIGGREIKCQHRGNRYVRDEALYNQYREKFNKTRGPSYKEIAEFIASNVPLSDITIAEQMILILTGEQASSDSCPIIPLILATIFIAESNRYPSSFMPSLLLIDLIRNQVDNCTFGPYTILNSLTNIELLNQNRRIMSIEAIIYPTMVGLFNQHDLQAQQIAKDEGKSEDVPTNNPIFYNLGKQRNGRCEKEDCMYVKPSDGLMRCAGWWPMTHRFSTTELKKQAQYKTEKQALSQNAKTNEIDAWLHNQRQDMTHSDIKSFCIMSDWIHHKGMGIPLHMHTVETLIGSVDFNQNPEVLEKLFTELFANADSLLYTRESLVLTDTGFMQPDHMSYTEMLTKAQEAVIKNESINFSASDEEFRSDDEDTYVSMQEASSILESTQTLSKEQHECYSSDDTTDISLSTWSTLNPHSMRGSPISPLSDSSTAQENIGHGQLSSDNDTSTESTKKSTVSSIRSYKDVLMGTVSSCLNKKNKNATTASISEPIASSQLKPKPKPLSLTYKEVTDLYANRNTKITQVPLIKVGVR